MSQEFINVGLGELTGDGETLRSAFIKINNNFNDIYQLVSDGGDTFSFVSETMPEVAGDGNLWLNTTNGKLYIYVDGQWIQPSMALEGVHTGTGGEPDPNLNAARTHIGDSPPDNGVHGQIWLNSTTGKLYVKVDDAWVQPDFTPTLNSIARIFVGDVPPTDAPDGALWLDSKTGTLYIHFNNTWLQPSYQATITAKQVVTIDAVEPPAADDGELWLNSTDNILYIRETGVWTQLNIGAYIADPNLWNLPLPTTVNEALDRIASFLNTKYGEKI